MAISMRGNFIFVGPDEKYFKVASNFTNYLELGLPSGEDYYLEARIEGGNFKINATLWEPSEASAIIIKDNLPRDSGLVRDIFPNGWRLNDSTGQLVLGLEANGNECHIRGRVRTKSGEIIAEESGDDFLVHRGPAVLGKFGNSRGIVIGA